MCKLSGINFGYADSEKELLETPELFDSAFVDPKNHLDKLLYKMQFLVLGRKGSGKTAYGAKIRRLAMENPDIVAQSCPLSNLNYSMFENFADQHVRGGRRFLNIWKYLLFLEMMKLIDQSCSEQENQTLNEFIMALKDNGLLPAEDIVHIAKHLNATDISMNFANIIKAEKRSEKETVLSDADEIADAGLNILKDVYFGETRFYIIVDGLDDALRGEKFSSDIITGLIRAADIINNTMLHTPLKFKIIILLRSDIFESCRDPDLTKIKRDSTINLSWTKEALQDIVIKRINNKYPHYKNFSEFWYGFAPQKYKNKSSISILFELTLLRPRDMLQFFIECQNLYGDNETLNYAEFSTIISGYSKNYFISEMKDELTGFVPDHIITAIPPIFSEWGKREFREIDISPLFKARNVEMSAHQLLETLFSIGYIGQLRSRGPGNRFVSFSHINPFDKYLCDDMCILHRGLVKALNVS